MKNRVTTQLHIFTLLSAAKSDMINLNITKLEYLLKQPEIIIIKDYIHYYPSLELIHTVVCIRVIRATHVIFHSYDNHAHVIFIVIITRFNQSRWSHIRR